MGPHATRAGSAAQPLTLRRKSPTPVGRFERRLVFLWHRTPTWPPVSYARSLLRVVNESRDYLRHPVGACNISI